MGEEVCRPLRSCNDKQIRETYKCRTVKLRRGFTALCFWKDIGLHIEEQLEQKR